MRLHLVTAGRTAPGGDLDPTGFDDVWSLREQLPAVAAWFCAPGSASTETAQLLTESEVGVLEGLRDFGAAGGWYADIDSVYRRATWYPNEPAGAGWETVVHAIDRLVVTVNAVLAAHEGEDVVLIGHHRAWSLLVGAIRDAPPQLEDPAGRHGPRLQSLELHRRIVGPGQS